MRNVNILNDLAEGFERHMMLYTISEGTAGSPVIIRFEEVSEDDCSLSVKVYDDRLEVNQIIGKGKVTKSFDPGDINDHFFEMLREHYDTINSLIKMRNKLLGLYHVKQGPA